GDLINTVAPVHVKQDGIVHNVISKVTSLPGEVEDIHASGSLLNYKGFDLKQSFASTGFNENVRVMTEYASRLYFIEAES
ncbi:MAG: alpha-galactosidase, partial [Lachnospiraceae bacterium]|nr:alpha-galactosidase [Lachnospiraceae bacterium]